MLNFKYAKTNEKPLTLSDIKKYYLESSKEEKDFKYGLEYEHISLDKNTKKSAAYNNIVEIIKHFASIKDYGLLYDGSTLIGAIKDGTSISLEPGCQLEISLKCEEKISDIEKNISQIKEIADKIAKIYDVEFFGTGLCPKSVYQNIDIVKKERYEIMAKHLPDMGKLAPVMMRESAGVQLNIDYKSEFDASEKIRLLSIISPFLTAVYANSPIRNNKLTNYKSFRALAWKYTDPSRCGIFYNSVEKTEQKYFEQYINRILDTPMLFIERENKKIALGGKITFRKFMQDGCLGNSAEFKDYLLHASLCFPDIRLKNCIEIRNHDSQNLIGALSVCAFYKGILNADFNEIFAMLKGINTKDIDNMGFLAAKHGLDFKYKNFDCQKIAKKLFKIAQDSLKEDEKKYLENPVMLIEQKMCPADIIINSGIKTGEELIDFLRR